MNPIIETDGGYKFVDVRHDPTTATPFQRGEHEARYKFASQFVKGRMVLDVGCGTCYGMQILKDAGAAWVRGFDLSDECLKSEHIPQTDVAVGDALKMPYCDKHFDVVVMLEVIEHIEDQEKAISEARRVLKDDGILILSTPNQAEHPGQKFNPDHVKELTWREINDLLKPHFASIDIMGFYFAVGAAIIGNESMEFNPKDFNAAPFYMVVAMNKANLPTPSWFIPFTTDRLKISDYTQ